LVSCIVVDDNEDIVEAFCDLLDLSGIEIFAKGHDGADAVKLYEKFQPDILFVDLSMPKYDGVYAIKNIRMKYPEAKIIVVTGDAGNDESYLRDTLKVNHIIYKPFNMHLIRESVTIALLSDFQHK
jgi:two-component system chemotaxis response regulator CheY